MRKLPAAAATFAALVAAGLARAATLAKGMEARVIVGSALAPYFFAATEPPPSDVPFGVDPQRADTAAITPGDASRMLPSAYDLYFGFTLDDMTRGAPTARYVPADGGRPAYLYWQSDVEMLKKDSWYLLDPRYAGHLDTQIAMALNVKVAGPQSAIGTRAMETDPLAEFVLHGRSWDGAPVLPTADQYVIATNTEFRNGVPPLARVSPAATQRRSCPGSLRACVTRWQSPMPAARPPRQFYVYTPDGQPVFAYVSPRDGHAGWLYVLGTGPFQADVAMDGVMTRAPASELQPRTASRTESAAVGGHASGLPVWMIVTLSSAGAVLFVAAGAGAIMRRRRRLAAV